MKYCRNRIIDRKIRDYEISINYWKVMEGQLHNYYMRNYVSERLRLYRNAVRRLEKLKNNK